MKIDLFNAASDEIKIVSAIRDGSFKFASPLYAKYIAKCAAQGVIVGTVVGLAAVGALATLSIILNPETEETE